MVSMYEKTKTLSCFFFSYILLINVQISPSFFIRVNPICCCLDFTSNIHPAKAPETFKVPCKSLQPPPIPLEYLASKDLINRYSESQKFSRRFWFSGQTLYLMIVRGMFLFLSFNQLLLKHSGMKKAPKQLCVDTKRHLSKELIIN